MTGLVYFVVAVISAALSIRAWLADRKDPSRIAFLGLGWAVAVAYAAFALSLLPGLESMRLVFMFTGSLVPAFALWGIDTYFAEARLDGTGLRTGTVFICAVLVATAATAAQWFLYNDQWGLTPPEILAGGVAFGLLGYALIRIWRVHESTPLRVDKVRMRYLFGVAVGAVFFSCIEQLARGFWSPGDLAGLTLTSRAVVLQGPIPPISALFTGLAVYFLYHSLVMYRLLDLYELFSRLAALLISAFALVVVDGVTILWVDTFTDYPFHSTFQIFLASVMFLAAYEPLRDQIFWWSNRLLNRRGQQLTETLEATRRELPTVISKDGLIEALLSRLHASGRIPLCSMYLWDPALDAYALAGVRGLQTQEPLAVVAAKPFTDRFSEGEPWYSRTNMSRRARTNTADSECMALLDAMGAELTLPFVSGGVVLGWLNLQDEEWSDGFSADEIQRIANVTYLATVVLSNIQDFQALEEEHRLAALGAMAAGLAHEIRNPLAGIKGAAQFLQHEQLPEDSSEMLNIVVEEADRLNVVVSQFLDYARPFEINRAPDHINALVTYTLVLLRAQGLPPSIEVRDILAGSLPEMELDRARLSQVLINLLRNALQAMPNGGTLTVETRHRTSRSGRPAIEIAVTDTGEGIAAEDMEKLFVPFFTRKDDGTGLGLAISQRIVQAHGGELDVHTAPGEGSTFVVRLPLPIVS